MTKLRKIPATGRVGPQLDRPIPQVPDPTAFFLDATTQVLDDGDARRQLPHLDPIMFGYHVRVGRPERTQQGIRDALRLGIPFIFDYEHETKRVLPGGNVMAAQDVYKHGDMRLLARLKACMEQIISHARAVDATIPLGWYGIGAMVENGNDNHARQNAEYTPPTWSEPHTWIDSHKALVDAGIIDLLRTENGGQGRVYPYCYYGFNRNNWASWQNWIKEFTENILKVVHGIYELECFPMLRLDQMATPADRHSVLDYLENESGVDGAVLWAHPLDYDAGVIDSSGHEYHGEQTTRLFVNPYFGNYWPTPIKFGRTHR